MAVSSCTAALHVALVAGEVGAGDEVVTSPYTFPSTIFAIIAAGARPVLVDTLADYPNIDADLVAGVCGSSTRVILPIHIAGVSCNMAAIAEVAERYGAWVLQDAAHAMGTEYHGARVGGLGRAAAYSLYAGKNITTGEGGVLVTNDQDLAAFSEFCHVLPTSDDMGSNFSRIFYPPEQVMILRKKLNFFPRSAHSLRLWS